MSLLQVDGLRKSFDGLDAVAGVSFRLDPGELLALIGPNGAGKSTCFNLLNGQLRPDAGRVLLDGEDITGRPPRQIWRLGVGRSFQVAAVFPSMTVRENVQVALTAHAGQTWRFDRPARGYFQVEADALLALVGMHDQGQRAAGVLAYGDVKRLELSIALAGDPRLLLMDEPTAGMAPAERGALMTLVRRLAKDRGMAVLFTEHDMEMVFSYADRILVLDRGQLIAEGDAASVRADMRVRAVYLGEDSV
jgi:branched-chain amino acid transport system ATP-binding protein